MTTPENYLERGVDAVEDFIETNNIVFGNGASYRAIIENNKTLYIDALKKHGILFIDFSTSNDITTEDNFQACIKENINDYIKDHSIPNIGSFQNSFNQFSEGNRHIQDRRELNLLYKRKFSIPYHFIIPSEWEIIESILRERKQNTA